MKTKLNKFSFSRDTYSTLMKMLVESGYHFSMFSEELSDSSKGMHPRKLLLRHDVDISMDYALDMARLEQENGVRSTYCLMLRSPMYNLMSRHSISVMMEIVGLGHQIGLHFDAGCARRRGKTIQEDIQFELEVINDLLGERVKVFSFHQPSNETIELQIEIPGVINTYHSLQLKEYKYISDSNRIWREATPFDHALLQLNYVHLLIHPIWWMCEEEHTYDCWDRAIERNFSSAQLQTLETERAYGPKRSIKIIKS